LSAQTADTLRLSYVEKILPFGLSEKIPDNLPKVGLALSGGGARAISQIGVLKALEEKQIPIEFIVGTSMGSIVGGLYSAGYSLRQLDSILNTNNWDEFYSTEQSKRNELFVDQKITEDKALISFRLEGLTPVIPNAISSGQRPANFLNLLSLNAPIQPQKSFDDYLYKFRAVTSNLVNGDEIILDKGSLGLAMRASSSVTFLLPPVAKDSLLLIDGGLVANIPAEETRDLGADIVVAVNSSSPLNPRGDLEFPWILADQLVSIPMQKLNRQQLDNADFVIDPAIGNRKNTDFKNLESIVKKGYDAALPVAKQIFDLFEKEFKKNLGIPLKYYKNLTVKNSGEIGLKLFDNLTNKDSISNLDLFYELYKLNRSDDFKDLYFVVNEDRSTSMLEIFATPNPIIKDFEITGDSLITKPEIEKVITPIIGKPYSSVRTLNTALEIMRLYKNKGFSFARIDSIRFDENSQILFVNLSEGIISKISVTGNTRTKEKLITRELPLSIGNIFKYNDAEKGLTNLRSTNLFDQVELDVANKNGFNEIDLIVAEKISGIIRLGMRIDNENYSQFSLDIRDENFNGTGTELGAILSGGVRNRSYIFEQKANRVFDSYLTYKVRAFYEFNDVNVYSDDSVKAQNRFSRIKSAEYRQIFYGGSFAVGAQVMRLGNLFAEARFQKEQVKNKSDYFGPTLDAFVTSLRFSLLVDTQNDYPYPTDGFLIKSFYETAQSALGGDIGYTKFVFDYKSIFSPHKSHTLTLHGIIGSADKTLPLTEQFSLGGQNSFFGMREYEYRGRQILAASFEYRYAFPFKIFFDTYIKARYDLGSIWAEREQIRFKDLKHGIGASLSFNTPVGPADFSVGKSFYFTNTLSKNSINWGPAYFYFTIGYYY
jgi:NTE family protein